MYFDLEAQESTLRHFAAALHPGGYLVIGRNDRPIEELKAGTLFQRIKFGKNKLKVYVKV